MKQMKKLINSGMLALLTLSMACASLETNSYKIIGATAVTVDAAMNGWGDFVRSGKASSEDQNVVRSAYEKYQKAMTTSKVAITTYQVSKDKTSLNLALDILDATKNDLIDAIQKGKL